MLRPDRLAVRTLTLLAVALALAALPAAARAQSLTAGALDGEIRTADGRPLSDARVTVETESGAPFRRFVTGRDGRFSMPLVPAGTYRVLAEQAGYQPVRLMGVLVRPGRTRSVRISLTRKPPPITSVVEIAASTPSGGTAGLGMGRYVDGTELWTLDRVRDLTDISRGVTQVESPRDGRYGFGIAAGGVVGRRTRFFVDALEELHLRHPGLPAEPEAMPVFERDGVDQVGVAVNAFDTEWRGANGPIVSANTRSGGDRLIFQPFATFSTPKAGGRSEDNPLDFSAKSFQAGFALGGPVIKDTAQFFIRADYQQIETPTPFPFERDTVGLGGAPVSLRTQLPVLGRTRYGASVDPDVSPTLRTWKGGSVAGRFDWRLGRSTSLLARVGYAAWKETNPLLGVDLPLNVGARLDANDFNGAVTIATTFSRGANELRFGVKTAKREWAGTGLAASYFTREAIGLGITPVLPADFTDRLFDVTDAFQFGTGKHRVKFSLAGAYHRYTQDYVYGSDGIYRFGGVDEFAAGTATYFQATATGPAPTFNVIELGLGAHDLWTPLAGLEVLFGARYDVQLLPNNEIALNQNWLLTSGLVNTFRPQDRKGFSPRIGLTWDVQSRGEWIIRGGAGVYHAPMDPATFAEVIQYDGDVQVRRYAGPITRWPQQLDPNLAPGQTTRLAMFATGYRNPRTSKSDVSITRTLPGGFSLSVGGGYHHTDYLLRRQDLNRPVTGIGATTEGRPVFGTLDQQGALLFAQGTSNRRFTGFDLVSALIANGYSDYYEFNAMVERRAARGLGLSASYTYSQTKDNVLYGLSGDPADQLSPFPDRLNGVEWEKGRSDFDVPHRVMLSAEWRSVGKYPVTIGARYRWRSGLPFTAGFQPGVDANADGSGSNDPAFLGDPASVPGLQQLVAANGCLNASVGGFAERNACREAGVHSVDVRLAVGIPLGKRGDVLALTVDAFNVAGSATGLVDRAAVLVDPFRSITTDGQGRVVLPLVANPNFGKLLVHRTEPRVIRVGLRVTQ